MLLKAIYNMIFPAGLEFDVVIDLFLSESLRQLHPQLADLAGPEK